MTEGAIQVVFPFGLQPSRRLFLGAQWDKLLESGPILVPSETASPMVPLVPGAPPPQVSPDWTGRQCSAVSCRPSQAVLVSGLASGGVGWPWWSPFIPLPDAPRAISCQKGCVSRPKESRAMPGSVGRRREG